MDELYRAIEVCTSEVGTRLRREGGACDDSMARGEAVKVY